MAEEGARVTGTKKRIIRIGVICALLYFGFLGLMELYALAAN
ncbi:MAG: hypothetical protein N4A65_07620 [Cohaesibacter sp.]|jgi:hypothetical protein|nr:hypothetical protein [Cohaesibacter sp.]